MRRFRKAILIIHGFTGNLCDNEYLMNYLEYEPKFDVFARTLPGHDKGRFSKAKYSEWINFVDGQISELKAKGYKKIYVVGHSMGGVLASYLAANYKEVKKLVLVNAAFDYINLKQNRIDLLANKDFEKYNHMLEKAARTSLMFVLEFTKLVKKYQGVLQKIFCKTLILCSDADEIIPLETGTNIYNKLESKKKHLTILKGCSHIALAGERKEEISEYICLFLKGGLKWKRNMKKEL